MTVVICTVCKTLHHARWGQVIVCCPGCSTYHAVIQWVALTPAEVDWVEARTL